MAYCYTGLQIKSFDNHANYSYKVSAYAPHQNITVEKPFWTSDTLFFNSDGKTQEHRIECKNEDVSKIKVVYFLYYKYYQNGKEAFARKSYTASQYSLGIWPVYDIRNTNGTTLEIRNNTKEQQISKATVGILIGGPYYDKNGVLARYGHVAAYLNFDGFLRVFDFGRYGDTWGTFAGVYTTNHEGEGILRVWRSAAQYLATENKLGRKTEGFYYQISANAAKKIKEHFYQLMGYDNSPKRQQHFNQYRLKSDYHAFGCNCTTVSMDGVKAGIPSFYDGNRRYRQMRGLNAKERAAYDVWLSLMTDSTLGMHIDSSLYDIFMPEDLEAFLNGRKDLRPTAKVTYGKLIEKK